MDGTELSKKELYFIVCYRSEQERSTAYKQVAIVIISILL